MNVIKNREMNKKDNRYKSNTIIHKDILQKERGETITSNINKNVVLPTELDGRIVWKDFLTPVIDQGKCGSCWAFASVQCLQDRFTIQSSGKIRVDLSPTKMIICDENFSMDKYYEKNKFGFSCFGNTLYNACKFLYLYGVSTETCLPYFSPIGQDVKFNSLKNVSNIYNIPFCSYITGPYKDLCVDFFYDEKRNIIEGTPSRSWRAYDVFWIKYEGDDYNIRYIIWKWGPVVTSMDVYDDFYDYQEGTIYKHSPSSTLKGGHSVVIVGWGESEGNKYWICRNTWGKDWGENGYFKIQRGTNECSIEQNAMDIIPDFFYETEQKDILVETEFEEKHDKLRKKRDTVDIDYTGFSKRVLNTSDYLPFLPIEKDEIPNWITFIAADVGKIKNDIVWWWISLFIFFTIVWTISLKILIR